MRIEKSVRNPILLIFKARWHCPRQPEAFKVGWHMEFKDYSILEGGRSASEDEKSGAYRKLARKCHPDVSKESVRSSHARRQ